MRGGGLRRLRGGCDWTRMEMDFWRHYWELSSCSCIVTLHILHILHIVMSNIDHSHMDCVLQIWSKRNRTRTNGRKKSFRLLSYKLIKVYT